MTEICERKTERPTRDSQFSPKIRGGWKILMVQLVGQSPPYRPMTKLLTSGYGYSDTGTEYGPFSHP